MTDQYDIHLSNGSMKCKQMCAVSTVLFGV